MPQKPEGDTSHQETHYTCTSTPLSDEPGSRPEHISVERLNQLHEEKTDTQISGDPATAIIEREQALVWHKRNSKSSL